MSLLQKPDLSTEQMSGRDTQMCLDQYQLLLCRGCSLRHRYSKEFAEGAQCCRSVLEKVALEIILLGVRGQILTTEERTMHIRVLAYPWWVLTTPVHTEQIVHCLSTGLIFLLCLLHPKQFWFPEVRERTELANGSEGNESSCGPESKARRAAGLGRGVNPSLGIQGPACGPSPAHLEHLGVCTYSSQMLLWFPHQLRKSYHYSGGGSEGRSVSYSSHTKMGTSDTVTTQSTPM